MKKDKNGSIRNQQFNSPMVIQEATNEGKTISPTKNFDVGTQENQSSARDRMKNYKPLQLKASTIITDNDVLPSNSKFSRIVRVNQDETVQDVDETIQDVDDESDFNDVSQIQMMKQDELLEDLEKNPFGMNQSKSVEMIEDHTMEMINNSADS